MQSDPNMQASGDIAPRTFVKVSGNFTVAAAGANEVPIGIAGPSARRTGIGGADDLLHAKSGEAVEVRAEGSITELTLGGTVVAGDELKADASGYGVARATTGTTIQNVGAIALTGGASGGVIRVLVTNKAVRPALA